MGVRQMGEAEGLKVWLRRQIEQPYSEPVTALVEALRVRYGEAVVAVLMYGSCLRSGDPFDGLVDLYVLVDDYSRAYPSRWLAIANCLLPPNVFYLEVEVAAQTLRAKYAVLSRRDFAFGMRWFQSYLWGRFAQPCRLLYRRDPDTAVWVVDCLLQAMRMFVRQTAPMCTRCFEPTKLWQRGLVLSYRTELRTERAEVRSKQLVVWAAPFYQAVTLPLLRELPWELEEKGRRLCLDIPPWVRQLAKLAWLGRTWVGKSLSLLRLIKAAFTFQGGVDYVIFKLERHTGQKLRLPTRARRHPLIYGVGVLWRWYRQGMVR